MNDEPKVWISSRKLKSGKRSYHLRWIDLATGKWRNQKVGTDHKRAERQAAGYSSPSCSPAELGSASPGIPRIPQTRAESKPFDTAAMPP